MDEIEIRPYQPSDWESIEKIHDAARRIELKNAGLSEAFIPLAQAAENESLFDYEVRVAVKDGEVAGFVAYAEDELAWLYVAPESMRQGIGRALVGYVMRHTDKRPLTIEVLCGNEPAKRLYESAGFQTVKIASGQMPGNERFHVSAYVMEVKEGSFFA